MTAPLRPAATPGSPGDLPPLDVGRVPARVRARSAAAGVDALLVTDLTNVRWLTGFTGSAGRVRRSCPTSWCSSPTAATASRPPRSWPRPASTARVAHRARRRPPSWTRWPTAAAAVGRARPRGRARDAGRPSGRYARRASPAELVADRRAGRGRCGGSRTPARWPASSAACAHRRRRPAPTCTPCSPTSPTEADVRAWPSSTEMRAPRRRGPELRRRSSPPARTPATPHHRPGDRRIREGDLVVLDFGALVDGYHSDMTRTARASASRSPSRPTLLDAGRARPRRAGVAAVRAGVAGRRRRRRLPRRASPTAGYGDAFTHGTGHGVGLAHPRGPVGRPPTSTRSLAGRGRGDRGTWRLPWRARRRPRSRTPSWSPATAAARSRTRPRISPCLPSPPTT